MAKSHLHTRNSLRALCAAAAVALTGTSNTYAQAAITWSTAPADGDWSDTSNWSGSVVPVTGDRAAFGASSVTVLNNDLTGVTLTAIGSSEADSALYFTSAAGAYTISGNTLALHSTSTAGGSKLVRNSSTATQTLNSNVSMSTTSGQDAEVITSGDLVFGGTVGLTTSANLALAAASGKTITFEQAVTLATASTKAMVLGGSGSNLAGTYTFNGTINKSVTSGTPTYSVNVQTGTANFNGATEFSNTGAKTMTLLGSLGSAAANATVNINHAGAFDELTQINIFQISASASNGNNGEASFLVGANGWSGAAAISIGTNANATSSVTLGGKTGLGSTGVATFSGNITALDSNNDRARTLTLTTPEGRVNFSGVISTASGGASVVSITKNGAGIVALSGANTYSGNTAVSAGTLLLNNTAGSATGSVGTLTVASGARLAGFGSTVSVTTIDAGARVTAGDIAAGANAPTIDTAVQANNTLTFSGSLTINGAYDWYLGLASETVGFSQLDVSGGNLILGGTSSFTLTAANFLNGLSPAAGDSFWASNRSWTIADVSGSTSITGSFASVDLGAWENGSFSLDFAGGTGNDLVLNWTASTIPEPSTYAIMLGGVGLFTGLVRRRRR